MNNVAFITGVTGQDGSYLSELLLEKGYLVVGLKRRTSLINTDRIDHLLKNKNFILEYYELDDVGSFYRLLNKYKPTEVYNLAAQSHVRVSFEIPEHTVRNITVGTLGILEAIRNTDPKIKYYQASSSEMYGDSRCPISGYTEESKMTPASPYACAKLFAHNLVRNYRISYGLHASSGILFNHESPRRGETFVTRKITMAAAKIKMGLQETLELGNLSAYRDWGHAKDYVEAMWLMTQQTNADDYVISTGKTSSVEDFLNYVFEIAGLDVGKHVKISERLYRPHEVPYLLGDSSKAKNVLKWQPKYDITSLAREMYESDLEKIKNG